ncbi:MAG: sensor histidine kinase [Patescibacteria group bacterium]|nr:sensor histidine kinase [Patescibacteria group bacterium]
MNFSEKTKNYLKEKPLRLMQFIILFTGLVLAFSYFFFFRSSTNNVRDTAIFLRLGIAETSRAEIENFIGENITALTELSKKIDLMGDENKKKDLIEKIMREKSWLMEISVADPDGNETIKISKFSVSNTESKKNIAESEEFQMASMGQLYLCKVHTDEKSIPILTIALPVESAGGEMPGVLVAQLSLQEVWNIITNSKLTIPGQKVYIVDSEGFLISHPDTSSVLKKTNLLDKPFVSEVIKEKKIVDGRQYVNSDKESVLVVGVPMQENLGWGIFAEESTEAAFVSYNQIQTAAGIFISLTFLLLFILIVNSRTLAGVFSDFKEEAKKRTVELKELDKTTKLLIRRDLDLSEANRRLEELDAVKSDFVSIAAHQLRTPLTGIKWSYLSLLEKETGPLNPDQQKIIEDGLNAINHTITLINDLLNVAHIEEGRFGFSFKNVSIFPVVQKAFERFQSLAGVKGIWFSIELPKNEPPPMSLDAEKIDLVLDNLLENAIKYTPPGRKVNLKLDYEGKKVKIIVSDTGIGIPRNQLNRVFTKFFRGENALLFQTSGTGLGLYMAKNIIDRHCGTISVESEENKGTTFTITLDTSCQL